MNPPIATPPHLPASTATPPTTTAEVMAVLKRMHDRLDQLTQLINRPYQP